MQNFDILLKNYREVFCLSEREKGENFERLMKNFLRTYSIYRGKFSDVWLWKNFPYRDQLGGKDLGIDIVAKTFDDEFFAVQCKFYSEDSIIDKSAVDSFISNSARKFFVDGVEKNFSARIWISTTENYSANALEMLKNQSPEVQIINLETLRRAKVNWTLLDNGFFGKNAKIFRNPKNYQLDAINAAVEHFQKNSRGQLIMACGTGKTFTSLKIAEKLFPTGKILFLVPSISLLSQTLDEWATFSENPINAVCICSDSTASKIDDEIVEINLPISAMTDHEKISAVIKKFPNDTLTVIFSTYQSIEVVHNLNLTFNLIICDEAHRTAGYTFGKDEKLFSKVHEDKFISAKKRLYMTATPRMFSSSAKDRKNESTLKLWSMDDEKTFGKEFYSISFKKAIDEGCLTDYKVLVLTIYEGSLRKKLLEAIHDKNSEIKVEETLQLVGCINALSKKCDEKSLKLLGDDLSLMHTAVAFCSSIKGSKYFEKIFSDVQADYRADLSEDEKNNLVNAFWYHVDGTMDSFKRSEKISYLKNTPREGNICKIVSNVRCLSEGVDVPALDAVIFIAPKKSRVEIVQAVGRAMRTATDKKYGYIIIPVVISIDKDPDKILSANEFKEVWQILNALRAHDERIDTWIEQIRLKRKSAAERKNSDENLSEGEKHLIATNLGDILLFDEFHDKIFARMIEFVGNPRYWTDWAQRVKTIVERHTRRIHEIISVKSPAQDAFYKFLQSLQKNLNPSVTKNDAVDMLAQHLVTKPIFEALFEKNSFAKNNPVSISMQNILYELDKDGMSKDYEIFSDLYNQVRDQCKVTDDPKKRQEIIIRLYDSFFKMALPLTAQKLGIVYTPVEVVDFILNSVNDVLQKNFGKTFSDKNIHILDGFTGTGTFITRLLQSGLIDKKNISYKFNNEIHANEIILLAYYIAAVNIENIFNSNSENYQPFKGICFTDTFQTYEDDDRDALFQDKFQKNSERIKNQISEKINVIIGNPPYSVGQKSANDNAQNNSYPKLKNRISETYAKNTQATNKNSLYDSYIKAFRWASDRIGESGVIGFVTNAGWIDGAAMDGMRKCFSEEFSEIYIFNLRGNQRTQGEISRKEGGKIFGSGSRAPIAITILVKNPKHNGDAEIFYFDIGDYLSREEKLFKISATKTVLSDEFKKIIPNDKGDWINQRGDDFENFIPLAPDKKFNLNAESFFIVYSRGVTTGRDAWIYNFSRKNLSEKISMSIDFYNENSPENIDETKFVWNDLSKQNKLRGKKYSYSEEKIFLSMYRPFCEENFYFDENLNERLGIMKKLFPEQNSKNILICVSGLGSSKNFSVFISKKICDYHFQSNCQCFSRYYYEAPTQGNLFGDSQERRDGVTDFILKHARAIYGGSVTKEDIFYYVYGFLHLPSYREKFSSELKKSLPRIFLVDEYEKFKKISTAGRELADIHLNYEKFSAPEGVEVEISAENYFVKKMKLSADKKILIYNEFITIKNIPPKSFEYVVNGRSPLEWIIERYQIKIDSASGIENNPNDWCLEHGDEKYILKLILSSMTVAIKTLEIVENLPDVEF